VRFEVDSDELALVLVLDSEHPDLELTDAGLGEELLRIAAEEQLAAARREQSPSGEPWADLAWSTIHAKHHDTVGLRTGDMLGRLGRGEIQVDARQAVWTYPHDGRGTQSWGKAHGFHTGRPGVQAARQLIGWSEEAKRRCAERIREFEQALGG
jgi:hypothetical protein